MVRVQSEYRDGPLGLPEETWEILKVKADVHGDVWGRYDIA
jgi:hypothetical protein